MPRIFTEEILTMVDALGQYKFLCLIFSLSYLARYFYLELKFFSRKSQCISLNIIFVKIIFLNFMHQHISASYHQVYTIDMCIFWILQFTLNRFLNIGGKQNMFSDEKRKEMSDKMHFDLNREDLYGMFSLRSVNGISGDWLILFNYYSVNM